MSPDVPEPSGAGAAQISRRRALKFLAGASLLAACDRPARRLDSAARGSTTTSTAAETTTTTPTTSPGTTTTVAATTTTAGPSTTTQPAATQPTTQPTTQPPAQPAGLPNPQQPLVTGPHPSGAIAGFAAFGDSGGGPGQVPVAQAMARWAAGHRIDALVTTGDNVYDYGEPHLFAAQLDEPYRELRTAGRPFWVTLGNHDVIRGHGPAQLAYLGLPTLPYVRELPGVRFFFLDAYQPIAAQARWLDERLAERGPAFSVVVFHPPVFSCGLHGPFEPMVTQWRPVLERHRVSLVLNGHDHLYQRFVSDAGVTYVVTGGGGYALYQLTQGCAPPEMRAAAVRHHFTSVEVFENRLVVTAVADDDTILDRAEIRSLVTVP